MQVVHGNIQIDLTARGFEAQNQGLGIHAVGQTLFVDVNFRWKHLEMEALVVEQGDGVTDNHVSEFADRLANHLVGGLDLHARQLTGDLDGDFRRKVEDDAAFDVSLDGDQGSDALAAISILIHRKIADFSWRLQGLGEYRVRGVNER